MTTGGIAEIEKKQSKLAYESILLENPNIKKTKIKTKQNFSGQSFFLYNVNSGSEHITDNKLQVCYQECHLPCTRSFH